MLEATVREQGGRAGLEHSEVVLTGVQWGGGGVGKIVDTYCGCA